MTSAGDLVSQTSQLRILHSTEQDNSSPFDSIIACLCQSIKINNNNKHIYRQSQVRKPIGSEVGWAECSLIIRTGLLSSSFCLILDYSVGLWVGTLVCYWFWCIKLPSFESCIQQRKTTCLLSIPKPLYQSIKINNKHVCMCACGVFLVCGVFLCACVCVLLACITRDCLSI